MITCCRAAAMVGALTFLTTACLTTACIAAPDTLPTLKSVWKQDLPAGTKRIGIADVTGDKKLRLLMLGDDGVLSVNKMTDAGPAKEDTISLGKQVNDFVVGQFAKDKPAVIVVTGSLFYREGDKYAKKDAPQIQHLGGTVRFADGAEKVIAFGGGDSPQAYRIDLTADNPVKDSADLPSPGDKPELFQDLQPMLPAAMFEQAPFPAEMKKGALIRFWVLKDSKLKESKKVYAVIAWQAETSHLALIDGSDIFPEPKPDIKPLWKSEKLAGKILDMVLVNSFKDAKQSGIYVLEATGEDGKGRQLEFFARE